MSSATSAVTYTSVYTDSEPVRAFWGADDQEISKRGIPRVIVLGYNGLLMQPGIVMSRIPQEVPEVYKDDVTKVWSGRYPMDGGDDGDDDDGLFIWR
ncbi:hypothetical protein Tco_1410425 [Tanacetum coccineum]